MICNYFVKVSIFLQACNLCSSVKGQGLPCPYLVTSNASNIFLRFFYNRGS